MLGGGDLNLNMYIENTKNRKGPKKKNNNYKILGVMIRKLEQ
jgi:hypothetical protein